jgi:hypothetical protein
MNNEHPAVAVLRELLNAIGCDMSGDRPHLTLRPSIYEAHKKAFSYLAAKDLAVTDRHESLLLQALDQYTTPEELGRDLFAATMLDNDRELTASARNRIRSTPGGRELLELEMKLLNGCGANHV